MTLGNSIRRSSYLIREATSWLMADAEANGYAMLGSTSEISLTESELALRILADEIKSCRERLIANTPKEIERFRIVK